MCIVLKEILNYFTKTWLNITCKNNRKMSKYTVLAKNLKHALCFSYRR